MQKQFGGTPLSVFNKALTCQTNVRLSRDSRNIWPGGGTQTLLGERLWMLYCLYDRKAQQILLMGEEPDGTIDSLVYSSGETWNLYG